MDRRISSAILCGRVGNTLGGVNRAGASKTGDLPGVVQVCNLHLNTLVSAGFAPEQVENLLHDSSHCLGVAHAFSYRVRVLLFSSERE